MGVETRSQARRLIKMRNEVRARMEREEGRPTTSTTNEVIRLEDALSFDTGFRLLDLPAELRTMIYDEVVGHPDRAIFLDNCPTPSLAMVCQTLRNEVSPRFVQVNTFHIMVEKCPNAQNARRDIAFKIRPSTLEWLRNLGSATPLFNNLVIHFSSQERTELIFTANPKTGVTMLHESKCCFCHGDPADAAKPIPRHHLRHLQNKDMLLRIIDQNEARYDDIRIRHERSLNVLESVVFDAVKGIKRESTALSVDDVMRIETALNVATCSFSLARHTANMKHLRDYPLLIKIKGETYALRRATAVEEEKEEEEEEEVEETETQVQGGNEEA